MKLDITFVIARILGPLLIAIGIALITQPSAMLTSATEVLSNEGLRVMGGVLGLGIGLTLAVLHTRFDGVTAIIVTLLGWLTVARGALHLLAPSIARDAVLLAMENARVVPIVGCVLALLGVWLAYTGYIAGALRVDTATRK